MEFLCEGGAPLTLLRACIVRVPALALPFTGSEWGECRDVSCKCPVFGIPHGPSLMNPLLEFSASFWRRAPHRSSGVPGVGTSEHVISQWKLLLMSYCHPKYNCQVNSVRFARYSSVINLIILIMNTNPLSCFSRKTGGCSTSQEGW